jgi:DUF1680 family protein
LLDGSFKTAQQLDAKYLLSLEPDRLLHNFRVNAGLPPKAPVYGGWESQEPWVDIRCHGHTLGHYLSACSMMFASTGEAAFRQRVDYIVADLRECQQSRGNGLICAFPDGAAPLENGLTGKPFAGVPWYTMHKVLAGLRDAHIHAGSSDALVVLVRLTDWIDTAARGVSDSQFQRMLDREHGGMSEVLADVSVLTGDRKYLALAERFTHRAVLDPLAAGRDTLDGLHSNTQIPKAIGAARLHELTAKPEYRNASTFFWQTVVERRSFATGGNGDVEHFFPPEKFAEHLQSAKTMETCCTHNLLRLTRALFTSTQAVAYADYYERALFNGILASQDPRSGTMTYFQATRPGYVKLYGTPTDSFWCCTGSGMENHAKYGDSIYFHDRRSLYVNLFIASEVEWAQKGVHVRQTTKFPDEPATSLTVRARESTRFTLKVRQPSWCPAAQVSINGQRHSHQGAPGQYIEIDRKWKDGDVVEVSLPMQLRLEPLPGAPDIVAVMYGPIVLAGRLGTEGITPGSDVIVNERTSGEMLNRPMELPQFAWSRAALRENVKRKSPDTLSFATRVVNSERDIELVPFHRIAHERYTLYWRVDPLMSSPDGRIALQFGVDEQGRPIYSVLRDGAAVLMPSRLGLVREDADFSRGLTLVASSPIERITDEYTLLTNKRKNNRYVANRCVVELRAPSGESFRIIFQVSNDGVAFRYEFPQTSAQIRRVVEEASSYAFLAGTRAWLQPMSAAKTGWQSVNPSYEEIYERDIAAGTPSSTGAGWVYPALFRSGDVWMLVSESSLPRNYCGTRLQSKWHSNEYTVAFPQPLESVRGGPVNPESTLPWLTPWRFMVIGTLKTIVESTLGTDLADKPSPDAKPLVNGPGKASWSWPLLGDDRTNFAVQKQFIDYAASMNWRYTLVDALWDTQIGYEKLKELVDYAAGKDVKILVWYNSAGDWNTAPQTPRDRMLTHESRVREFERLKAIGVVGLKVDFFGGDGQSVIAYYHDILQDTVPYGFLMNFHGATLPRGWHRTYPHLMTTEAVRGLEFVTFEQKNAEDEPTHAAMLPFTRNVFDPMDFTPVVLDRIQRIERRTTSAFELALSVLFTSGIQHYAEIPEGMAKAPEYVREFLRHVPSVWDDVRFLDGFPGKRVVIARQGESPQSAGGSDETALRRRAASDPTRAPTERPLSGPAIEGRWYVAGINAENEPAKVSLSFADLPVQGRGTLITDGPPGNLSFRRDTVQLTPQKTLDLTIAPRGGFVLVFD